MLDYSITMRAVTINYKSTLLGFQLEDNSDQVIASSLVQGVPNHWNGIWTGLEWNGTIQNSEITE